MAGQIEVTASRVSGTAPEVFKRESWADALALATELEKEGRAVEIDGKPFLNTAGPKGSYLHQNAALCPFCVDAGALREIDDRPDGNMAHRQRCARCKKKPAEYYSVKPTHYHSRAVEGVPGHIGIHDILCYDCHRKDRYEVYGEGYGEQVA